MSCFVLAIFGSSHVWVPTSSRPPSLSPSPPALTVPRGLRTCFFGQHALSSCYSFAKLILICHPLSQVSPIWLWSLFWFHSQGWISHSSSLRFHPLLNSMGHFEAKMHGSWELELRGSLEQVTYSLCLLPHPTYGHDDVYCTELPLWGPAERELVRGWGSRIISPFLFSALVQREELKHQIWKKQRELFQDKAAVLEGHELPVPGDVCVEAT